ncbi:MAG: hypothetical protein ACREGH_03540 [Minisyncoccia bacterium]
MQARSLTSAFAEIHEPEPPSGLYARILTALARARRRRAMRAAVVEGALSLLSATALFEAARYAAAEAYLSGFLDYVHFIATDTGLFATAWKQFALSLIESLPGVSLIFIFAALFALVWSVSHTLQNVRTLRSTTA